MFWGDVKPEINVRTWLKDYKSHRNLYMVDVKKHRPFACRLPSVQKLQGKYYHPASQMRKQLHRVNVTHVIYQVDSSSKRVTVASC